MPTFQLAHIREQGVDLIIIPLDHDFEWKTDQEKNAIIAELQTRATGAGLAGRVVPIWDSGGGRMSFIAPRNWHPFFQSISIGQIYGSLNRTLSW
jgi:hypothetical protein